MEQMEKYTLIKYKFEKKYLKLYFNFFKKLYCNYKFLNKNLVIIKKSLSAKNPYFKKNDINNFIILKNNKVLGHISAIIDKELFEKSKIGILGFFECDNNPNVSEILFKNSIDYLKNRGCKEIVVPINLSIWNQYRISENQKKTFSFEPLSKKYYEKLILNSKFSVSEEYYSAIRDNFDLVIKPTKKNYIRLLKEGYKFKKVNLFSYNKDLKIIFNLSQKIFRNSSYFSNISFEEFKFFLKINKNSFLRKKIVHIVFDKSKKPVGFCYSYSEENKKIIILKTLGVLPDYQNKGIGAALLFLHHNLAKKKKYKHYIYALIRKENNIEKLPYSGAKIIRNYKTYKLKV